jgi:hypothetical protein
MNAINDFIQFGFVRPGDHLYKRMDRAQTMELGQPGSICDSLDSAQVVHQAHQLIEQNIAQIIESGEVDAFALSGGADSRLIFSILCKNHLPELKSLYIYTRSHPRLSPDQDRDLIIAKSLCQEFGLKHNHEVAQIHPQVFLTPQDKSFTRPLCGLWGSELIGGGIYRECLFDRDRILASRVKDSDLLSYLWDSGISTENYAATELLIHFHLLSLSELTAFYQSITWLKPKGAMANAKSPYFDSQLARLLCAVNKEYLSSFSFNRQLLETYASEFLKVPINNIFMQQSQAPELGTIGLEPKDQKTFFYHQDLDPKLQEELLYFTAKAADGPYKTYLISIIPRLSLLGDYI